MYRRKGENIMTTLRRYSCSELNFPVDGYNYDLHVETSVDGGKNWYYGGNGRYFREGAEVGKYIAENPIYRLSYDVVISGVAVKIVDEFSEVVDWNDGAVKRHMQEAAENNASNLKFELLV